MKDNIDLYELSEANWMSDTLAFPFFPTLSFTQCARWKFISTGIIILSIFRYNKSLWRKLKVEFMSCGEILLHISNSSIKRASETKPLPAVYKKPQTYLLHRYWGPGEQEIMILLLWYFPPAPLFVWGIIFCSFEMCQALVIRNSNCSDILEASPAHSCLICQKIDSLLKSRNLSLTKTGKSFTRWRA